MSVVKPGRAETKNPVQDHASGDPQAIRTQSVGPWAYLMEFLDPENVLKHARRDPSGGRGVSCVPENHFVSPRTVPAADERVSWSRLDSLLSQWPTGRSEKQYRH